MSETTRTFSITLKAGHPFVGLGEASVTKEGISATSMRDLLEAFGLLVKGELHGIAVDEYNVGVTFKMTECETTFPHDPTVVRNPSVARQ